MVLGALHLGCSKSLTLSPTAPSAPAPLPLNDEIVFVAPLQASGVPMPLYKVHPDGTGLSMVCNTLQCNDPCWSPDKTKIVFSSWGTLEICNADGSGLTQPGPIGECPA